MLTRQFSPYELNPLNINPLRDLVAFLVDFERVNRCADLKVFVTATNVRTGRGRTFTQPNLSVDEGMASACLPFMYQAVEQWRGLLGRWLHRQPRALPTGGGQGYA